jgi:hypothetical protein
MMYRSSSNFGVPWLCGDGDTELEIFRLRMPSFLAIGLCGQEPSSGHPVRPFSPLNDAPSATPHKEIYSSSLDSESVGFMNNTHLYIALRGQYTSPSQLRRLN